MTKCGLDQNHPVYLGWGLGADKCEVTRAMKWLGGNIVGHLVPSKADIFYAFRQAAMKGLHWLIGC